MTVSEEDIKAVIKKVETYINYNYPGSEKEDMISASSLGITKALATFDSTKASFIKYGFIRGVGEALDYLRAVPSHKHKSDCKKGTTILFSQYKIDKKKSRAESDEFVEFDIPVEYTGEYNLKEIRQMIINYYKRDKHTRSKIKANIIVEHYIDGIPKYKLAEKYNITSGAVTQFTDETEFKLLLDMIVRKCIPS